MSTIASIMSMPGPNPDAIADCVLTAFQALPAKCKPRVDVGGIQGKREWVPLAGIVLGEGGMSIMYVLLWPLSSFAFLT